MYILWEPYKDGYTVKDTKDGVIEYFTKPVLRKLFRRGIEIKGITCDEKNVIHFHAQHSMSELKKQASATKAKLVLAGKVEIDEEYGKVFFTLNGTEGVFKVPYMGNYAYEIYVKGSGIDAQQSLTVQFDDLIKKIIFTSKDITNVSVKLSKATTLVKFIAGRTVKDFTIDFNHAEVTPSGSISNHCNVTIKNYSISSIYSENSSFYGTRVSTPLTVPQGITNFTLDYFLFTPPILRIPRHVKVFTTQMSYCKLMRGGGKGYTKASDYMKRAEFIYKELYNNTANLDEFNYLISTNLYDKERLYEIRRSPYILILEDPKSTRIDTELRGMVIVIPKGTRSYIGENASPKYNIILEV